MPTNPHHAHLPAFDRKIASLRAGDAGYPPGAISWPNCTDSTSLFTGATAVTGAVLATIGRPELLARPSIGLLCSIRCPGNLILMTYEFAKKTPIDGAAIIGGFHSPMERTCLDTLLARHVPVVHCPARRLNVRGIPRAWDTALAEGRLLVVSPFGESQRHVDHDLARQRNHFLAAIANELFVPFAVRGGKTEAVVRASLHRGKVVYTLCDEENRHLVDLGVRGVTVEELLAQTAQKTVQG